MYITASVNLLRFSTSVGGSGIPCSSSISAWVFPHISLVTENVVAGHPVLVCSLEDSMNGRKVKFLVDERKEKLIQ